LTESTSTGLLRGDRGWAQGFAHGPKFDIEVPGKPLRLRKSEVDYLTWQFQTQIGRSARVLPALAPDECHLALMAHRVVARTAR
jgi:hypothetical protein